MWMGVRTCVHNSWLVMLAIIAEDSSPENESRDGHQQNELAILKTFVCVCVLLAMV